MRETVQRTITKIRSPPNICTGESYQRALYGTKYSGHREIEHDDLYDVSAVLFGLYESACPHKRGEERSAVFSRELSSCSRCHLGIASGRKCKSQFETQAGFGPCIFVFRGVGVVRRRPDSI